MRYHSLTSALWLLAAAALECFGVLQGLYTVAWTVGFIVGGVSGLTYRLVMIVRNSRRCNRLLDAKNREGLATASVMLTS